MLKETCPICTEKLQTPVLEPSCQNLFCGQCLLTWLHNKQTCPLCRANIITTDLVYLSSEEKNLIVDDHKNQLLTPLEKVIDILNTNREGKFIIFSLYDATFKPICKILDEHKISFALVKGSQKMQKKSIEDFRYGNIKVIFLNSNFYGAGVNLQEASDIILYHEMESHVENQILGRANRIGRIGPLYVHHIQVDN